MRRTSVRERPRGVDTDAVAGLDDSAGDGSGPVTLVRLWLVNRCRRAIECGDYLTPVKLDIGVAGLLDEVFSTVGRQRVETGSAQGHYCPGAG